MIIKSPVCVDVSHWKEIPDFKLVSPKPSLFITKATEAHPGSPYYHTDEKFPRFFEGMMEIGSIRGAYHFHRKSLNPYRQADHFINVISKMDILPTDLLILDAEEGGERAAQLWAWFEQVKKAYPNNKLILYSRKNILDPIYMTEAEKRYFQGIKIWTAGYPFFPDLFSKVPVAYVPDRSKYGETVLWQYSEKGSVQGIQGAVDLNWIEPAFYESLGDNSMAEEAINFTGTCTDGSNKVWSSIGGTQIGNVKDGSSVRGDRRASVAGILYLHLTSPIVGWTKKQWFNVVYQTEPVPPPPPPPPPTEEYILHVKDGVTRKFIPE